MKRRNFLKTIPVAIGGLTVHAYGASPLLSALSANLTNTDHVLVIVQLSGGNDGLNTVIPLDQYSALSQLRSNVLIEESKALVLSGTGGKTALNPAMTRFAEMWEEGELAIVQGVGYPNFNYSHFRATDIMMTGSDSDQILNSGWAGRYLNYEYPNFPVGYPNATVPHPLGIRIGGNVGLGLQNMGVNMAISINNTNDPLDLSGNIFKDPTDGNIAAGKELLYIREVQRQTDVYGDVVQEASNLGKNLSSLYPTGTAPGTSLANALKIVARLIDGGLQSRIYWVSTGGFDTHSNQVNTSDTSTGTHATLLQGVSDAIYAFMDDIKLLGKEDRVAGMTFSEFGRRIKSNGSGGTDHGSAQPMFFFGKKVVPGMVGENPTIDPNATSNTNLAMQYDFRSVYASVLQDWFCVPEPDIDTIMLNNYQTLPVLDASGCKTTSTHQMNNNAGENLISAYPNPFVDKTNIKFESKGGHTMVQVFTAEGYLVRTLIDSTMVAGLYETGCDLSHLPVGMYYIRLQNGTIQQVKSIMKAR